MENDDEGCCCPSILPRFERSLDRCSMRQRPSSRLLIVDPACRTLLFRFEHKHGALSGRRFWATPGGAVKPGESFEQAACREMLEEIGSLVENPGTEVAQRVATSPVLMASL